MGQAKTKVKFMKFSNLLKSLKPYSRGWPLGAL